MGDDVDCAEPVPYWMRPRPRRPSESECCGSGCVPCVFDVYDQDLKKWEEELASGGHGLSTRSDDSSLSPLEFREFRLVKIRRESNNVWRYTFIIPENGSLKLKMGQHIVLRYV